MASTKRTAFVTGSGANIGRACVLHLAKGGFDVIVNGSKNRDACEATAAEARKLGIKATVLMGDTGNRTDNARMIREALAFNGSVDALVHNAAIRPHQGFLEMSEEEWQRVFDVNFSAALWLARAFLPGMIEKGWGLLVSFVGLNAIGGHAGRKIGRVHV